jgi:hypothetical protein
VTAVLGRDADRWTWVVAPILASRVAGYRLATGDPVMAMGGLDGTDPSATPRTVDDTTTVAM